MYEELGVLEDATRSLWKVLGKNVIESDEPFRQEFTLLLLTDEEMEKLCQSYAERLRELCRIRSESFHFGDGSWPIEEGFIAQERLDHFAKVWSEERVQSILDKAFEGYEQDKERLQHMARLEWEKSERERERLRLPF